MRIKIAGEFREPKCYDCINIEVDERGVATVTLKAPTFREWWETLPRLYQIIITDTCPTYKTRLSRGLYSDIDPDVMSAMQEVPRGFYAIHDAKAWSIMFQLLPTNIWKKIENITGSPDAFIKNAIAENFPDKCRKEIWDVIQLCRGAGYYLDKYVN